MISTLRTIPEGPLRFEMKLVVLSFILGIAAYVPTWHGTAGTLLKLAFWSVACLSVLILPFVTKTRDV